MMPFAEKLTFLMHITETSNKELAAELEIELAAEAVDPLENFFRLKL